MLNWLIKLLGGWTDKQMAERDLDVKGWMDRCLTAEKKTILLEASRNYWRDSSRDWQKDHTNQQEFITELAEDWKTAAHLMKKYQVPHWYVTNGKNRLRLQEYLDHPNYKP